MHHVRTMEGNRQHTLQGLRTQIDRGEYHVDADAVAAAILERIRCSDSALQISGLRSPAARGLREARLRRRAARDPGQARDEALATASS